MRRYFRWFLIIGIVLAGCLPVRAVQPDSTKQASTFFLKTLEGDSFFLSHYVGEEAKPRLKQPVVLSFFATWCVPCRAEIPVLHTLQQEFPDTKFLLVNVNEKQDLVARYKEKMEITLPILMDIYGIVAEKYRVIDEKNLARLPAMVIINEDGQQVYFHRGYEKGDEEQVREILSKLVQSNR